MVANFSTSYKYRFQYTNKNNPCPLCGKTNGNCRVGFHNDRVRLFCMTFRHGEIDSSTSNWKYCHTSVDGCWGIYKPEDEYCSNNFNNIDNYNNNYKGFLSPTYNSSSYNKNKSLSRKNRNYYFSWLLKQIPLIEPDQKLLIEKGLLPQEIKPDIFGSVDQGILIVFRDVYGYKVGAQVRKRIIKTDENRYFWYTNNKIATKLENDQIPVAVWKNANSNTKILCLCEGYLKSYIAYCQYQRLNINYPWLGFGAVSYLNSGFKEIQKTIEYLNPETIVFFPDAGFATNKLVAEAYQNFWKKLQVQFPNISLKIASWQHEYSKFNDDIDELHDKTKIKIYNFSDYLTYFHNIELYDQNERLIVWHEKLKNHKFILDSSPTGTGKSFDAGRVSYSAVYISNDHRNPTVETLHNWDDVESRHGGLYRDEHGYLRRVNKNSQNTNISPDILSNCYQHEKHQKLREHGYQSAYLCKTCEYLLECQNGRGEGYGYLYQRKISLMSDKIRIHPDSLPKIDKFNYQDRTIIIEEAADINMVEQRSLTVSHINKSIEILNDIPDICIEEKNKLIEYLKELQEKIKGQFNKRYGIFNPVPAPEISQEFQITLWNLSILEQQDISVDEISDVSWQSSSGFEKYKLNKINELLKQESLKTESIIKDIENKIHPGIIWLISGQPSWISNDGCIHVYKAKTEIQEIIKAAKNVIFLDATANRDKIALLYGIPATQICHISAKTSHNKNLEIEQIKDLGKLCQQRGKDQLKRLNEIIKKYREIEPNTRVIDLLKFSDDSCWWRDSRGRNQFQDCKQLLLVGTPSRNWNQMLCYYLALGGEQRHFQVFYNEQIKSDIMQGIGRIRSERRTNEKLKVVLITNFSMDLPIKQVRSQDISPQAAPKAARTIQKIADTYLELQDKNLPTTQTAIANHLNIARETVNRCWKKVQLLLETKHSKSAFVYEKFDEFNAQEITNGIIEIYNDLVDSLDNNDLQSIILNMLFEIPKLDREKWIKYIFHKLYHDYQTNMLIKIEKILDSS